MILDLRSDTFTKPTQGMRNQMVNAKVGDDVFGEDPTVNELEKSIAKLFGLDVAIFCPTATMCNQIAIKLHTKPMDEIICENSSHIYRYEVGGIAFHSGCLPRLILGERGVFNAQDIKENLNPIDVHKTITALVSIENTHNRGGGKIFPIQNIKEIKTVCDEHNLKLHLDGSRIFNAIVATQVSPIEYGKLFDTITICLSKGLGCPAGALLLCNQEKEFEVRRIRKAFGGGMRQAGILAAAGIYAIENNLELLELDHIHAKEIEATLMECSYIDEILKVETNIIIFHLQEQFSDIIFIQFLESKNILAFAIGNNWIRFVTHLDFVPNMIPKLQNTLLSFDI